MVDKIISTEEDAKEGQVTETSENSKHIKLDYTIKTSAERAKFVEKILENYPNKPTARYLEILADYIEDALTREEKKEKGILSENRMVTIRKRETSYEGLVDKFENG